MEKSDKSNNDNEYIYKEHEINKNYLLLAIVFFVIASFFIFYTSFRQISSYNPIIISLSGSSVSAFLLSIFLLLLKTPLIMYKNGFSKPTPIIKSFTNEDELITFDRIKHIYPIYVNMFGTMEQSGFQVILKNDDEIIISSIKGNIDKIKSSFKEVLGYRWNDIYIDKPHYEKEQLNKIQKTSSKPLHFAWLELFMVTGTSLTIFILAIFKFSNLYFLPLYTILLFIIFFYECMRFWDYYNCKMIEENFLQDRKKHMDPSRNIVDRVKNYNKQDWTRLEKLLNVRFPYFFALIGAGLMIITMLFQDSLPFSSTQLLITIFAILISISFSYHFLVLIRKKELVEKIIKIELQEDRQILPDYFEIRNNLGLPLREKPDFSEKKWRKLVRASKFDSLPIQLFGFSMVFLSMAIISLIVGMSNIDKIMYCLLLFFIPLSIFLYVVVNMLRISTLKTIFDYEEHTGKKAIPDRFRSKIKKGIILSK